MQDEKVAVNGMSLALFYMDAKEVVVAAGFADEIDWQEGVTLEDVTESMFLREAA